MRLKWMLVQDREADELTHCVACSSTFGKSEDCGFIFLEV